MELLRKLLNIAATSLVTIAWSSSAMFVAAQNTSPLTTADAPQSNSTTEDRILYGPALPRSTNVWNSPQTITLTGTIETLDQQAIVFVDTLGERRKLPSDRIEAIEVNSSVEATMLEIPMSWVYASVPVSAALMLAYQVERTLLRLKGRLPLAKAPGEGSVA